MRYDVERDGKVIASFATKASAIGFAKRNVNATRVVERNGDDAKRIW